MTLLLALVQLVLEGVFTIIKVWCWVFFSTMVGIKDSNKIELLAMIKALELSFS
jgi:hypothetical protein